MATKELREAKDHNVRVRCTPQEKFAIEFAARVARKSYSHLVLDAVAPVVEAATWRGKSWRDYEDPTPGYAWCLMFIASPSRPGRRPHARDSRPGSHPGLALASR